MTADHVVALDVGTQSARAVLVDPRGSIGAMGRVPFEPYVVAQPGWAEQDPEVYWQAVTDACAALWAQPEAAGRRSAVAGLTFTTQRGTVVVAGADGRPLRPAITWLDRRRTGGVKPVGGMHGAAFRVAGASGIIAGFQAECEANWIASHEPAVWRRVGRYGLLSAFVAARLTGEWVDSSAAQVGYLPFDPRRFDWAAPGDWRWKLAPFDPATFPRLVPPTGQLGELTASAAAAVGLPAGTPVVAAAADKACEALGAGAFEPHQAALSLGTAATVSVTIDRYVEPIRLVPPFPAAVPGRYSTEVAIYRGFWLVDWFRREFGLREAETASRLDLTAEQLFDELVGGTPPGASGLLLQPTWSPGHRIPGPEARGAIVGWGPQHTRAHLYRAILEGLAYGLREGGERIEGATRVPIRSLHLSGGGSQSPAVRRILADVFGRPAVLGHTHETSALGAAIVATAGLGIHPDVPSAARAMTRIVETRDPDPAVAPLYDRLYREVYRPLYPRLQPLYRRLRRILRTPAMPEPPGA